MRSLLFLTASLVLLLGAGCESVAPASWSAPEPPTDRASKAYAEKAQFLARHLGMAGYSEDFDEGIRCMRAEECWQLTWALRYHAQPPTACLQVEGIGDDPEVWPKLLADEADWLQDAFVSQPVYDQVRAWIREEGPRLRSAPGKSLARRTFENWTFELELTPRRADDSRDFRSATLRWSSAVARRD
jgi:hypothetical protein